MGKESRVDYPFYTGPRVKGYVFVDMCIFSDFF